MLGSALAQLSTRMAGDWKIPISSHVTVWTEGHLESLSSRLRM